LIAEEKINLMTEILPPFQYYDEEKVLTGISIEIIVPSRELLEECLDSNHSIPHRSHSVE
jgi:hypothetical protein